MVTVDTLLHARWVIPVEPDLTCLEHTSLALHAGRIVDILPTATARTRYTANEILELPNHARIGDRGFERLRDRHGGHGYLR